MRPSVSDNNVELTEVLSHVRLRYLHVNKLLKKVFLSGVAATGCSTVTFKLFSFELRPLLIVTISIKPQTQSTCLIT